VVVKFEWDERKRADNIRDHGIDFVDAKSIFEGYTVTISDDRFDYGEDRFITFGLLRETIIAVAHTEDEETIRLISARKATKREARAYVASLPH
jgi:hypothetical protein